MTAGFWASKCLFHMFVLRQTSRLVIRMTETVNTPQLYGCLQWLPCVACQYGMKTWVTYLHVWQICYAKKQSQYWIILKFLSAALWFTPCLMFPTGPQICAKGENKPDSFRQQPNCFNNNIQTYNQYKGETPEHLYLSYNVFLYRLYRGTSVLPTLGCTSVHCPCSPSGVNAWTRVQENKTKMTSMSWETCDLPNCSSSCFFFFD